MFTTIAIFQSSSFQRGDCIHENKKILSGHLCVFFGLFPVFTRQIARFLLVKTKNILERNSQTYPE